MYCITPLCECIAIRVTALQCQSQWLTRNYLLTAAKQVAPTLPHVQVAGRNNHQDCTQNEHTDRLTDSQQAGRQADNRQTQSCPDRQAEALTERKLLWHPDSKTRQTSTLADCFLWCSFWDAKEACCFPPLLASIMAIEVGWMQHEHAVGTVSN